MSYLNTGLGRVSRIVNSRPGIEEILVDIDGVEAPAVNYPAMTGPINPGDQVLLNTTAVDLRLGTGGVHFVLCNLTSPTFQHDACPGHIIKLRYTPLQSAVLAVEEDESPAHDAIRDFAGLKGMPVVCCELHSQIAPAAAAVKASTGCKTRIAYIMTDGAALPLGFSRLVAQLQEIGLVDTTITCGQAFGGDLEAINLYSGLIAAKEVAKADIAIISQGPGNAGSGSKYGFSGIQQGEALNAVNVLGGCAIAAVRMSFADPRERHRGVSHHALTILEDIAIKPATVALPELGREEERSVEEQLRSLRQSGLHSVRIYDGEPGLAELDRRGVVVKTMGRSVAQDRVFFLAASAAGAAAAERMASEE
jgi:hypothetical protein